jgi:acyl-CoA thioester hydrolase
MPRIKIELPEYLYAAGEIPIRITDLNYGGHVGNDRFLALLHEARVLFLQQYGYGELNVEGLGLMMTDAAIEFKAELFHGDTVRVFMAAHDFNRLGFDFVYRLEVIRNEKTVVAALAKTGMICFDYTLKKPAALPEAARLKLLTKPV